MKVNVLSIDNEKAGTIDLADEIFGAEVRGDLVQRTIVWQLAKRRSGTRKTKTLGEISYSTRKIYRQKGTGHARHGHRKANQFRKGYKAHGPVVRDHAVDLPKKVRKAALRSALSAKAADGRLVVLDAARLPEPKTQSLRRRVDVLGWQGALVIDGAALDTNFCRAARNLPDVNVLPARGANVYDIVRCAMLVLTRDAVTELEARLK
jgi:large subunit ribosomal protein L4